MLRQDAPRPQLQASNGNGSQERPGRDVQRELNRLEELILSSPRIPLTRRTLIDEEQAIAQLDRVWSNLPPAFAVAIKIIEQRDEIIHQAQQQADRILEMARDQAARIMDETGIVQQATQQANQIRERTAKECEDFERATHQECDRLLKQTLLECNALKDDADTYARAVLADLERQLIEKLKVVRNGQQSLARENQERRSSKASNG